MICLSQSDQCRLQLFRPNERSFATLHHTVILQVLQAIAIANFYHKNRAIRYLLE